MNELLSNILEIYRNVVQKQYALDDAAAEVGKEINIDKSALLSSCTKELNISSEVFNSFIVSDDPFNFKNFLVRRFPADQSKISRFFNTFEEGGDIPVIDLTKIIKASPHTEHKYVSNSSMLSSLKEDIQYWITRHDVPQDVKDAMKDWVRKMEDQHI